MEGLLEDTGDQPRLADGNRPLGDRLGNRLDVDRLEILLVQLGPRCLAGDAQNGD